MASEDLDRYSDTYLAPTADRRVDQFFVEAICDEIIPGLQGPRILEMGVGDQVWTPKLLRRFADVTSVDGSKILLDRMGAALDPALRDRWSPVHSYFEDYRPAAPYDEVLATSVLEHVDDPAVVLAACRGWLRPGGRLQVLVPHAMSLHRRLAVEMGMIDNVGRLGEADRRLGHKHCFTWVEMDRLIGDAGFRVLSRRGLFTKLLPNALMADCTDAQLLGMVALGKALPIDYAAVVHFVAEPC